MSTNMNRYNRQIQVPQIGQNGQQKLANAHVAIVGMGGLGCPASLYLVGAGVGKITLIDHDVVSLSNLHRQILYKEADIGKYKSEVAKQALTELNNDIQIISHTDRLTADNIASLLVTADVLVDASDNFAISYLLSDYAKQTNTALVSASVIGVQGYLGVFCKHTDSIKREEAPSIRAVFPNPPNVGQDCNSVGVIGTSAGVMGTLQAQEVIKVILGDANQLAGRLLSLDLWTYRQSIMDFNHAMEPSVMVHIIAKQQINRSDMVIDVRTESEVHKQAKILPNINIVHLPMAGFKDNDDFQQLPKDRRIVLTCSSGQRALSIADKLIDSGFSNVAVWL